MMRIALERIVEALQDGDVDFAYHVALAGLEDGPVVDLARRRRPCPVCGPPLRWPGELEKHLATAHAAERLRAAA